MGYRLIRAEDDTIKTHKAGEDRQRRPSGGHHARRKLEKQNSEGDVYGLALRLQGYQNLKTWFRRRSAR